MVVGGLINSITFRFTSKESHCTITEENGSVENLKHVQQDVVQVYKSFVKDITDHSDNVKLTKESDLKANAFNKAKRHARTTRELHFLPQQLRK